MSRAQAKKDQPTKLITKPIADPHDTQSPKTEFRKLNLPADETEKDLFLVVLDKYSVIEGEKGKHDNNYQIYLGRSKTFKRGEGPDQYNMLVPLTPRCYATPDRDPAKAVEVPEGWLYIIRQLANPLTGNSKPELWRELKSDGLGYFSDVNLKRFKGKDQRRATGQSGLRIIVPYCIDKQGHDLWIAYSEVQWSWARVQSMLEKHELRNRRMHKLDLSDCLNNFANSNYTAQQEQQTGKQPNKQAGKKGSLTTAPGSTTADSHFPTESLKKDPFLVRLDEITVEGAINTALLYNLESAPDPESQNLARNLKDAIPVVYLDNPIGIGRILAREYQQHWQELNDCVNDLRAMPSLVDNPGLYAPGSAKLAEDNAKRRSPERWFEAAALANRYFYSKISKEIPPGVKDKDTYKKRLTEIEEQFIQYQNMLDKTAIEQAIRVPQRRAIREKLVQARDKLVDFLEKELAVIGPESGEKQDPPLVHALDDYFTLTPLGDRERKQIPTDVIGDKSTPRWRDNYLDGWGALYGLVALLGKHEYSIDADLEANQKDGWDWRRNNPAFELLRKLADPEGGCPLHSRLFPKPAAGDALKIAATKVEDTATAFKIQHFNNFKNLNRRDGDICKGLNLFGSNFNELMAMRDKNDSAYEKSLKRAQYSVLRLIEGAIQEEFKETEKPLSELIAEAEKQLEGKKDEGIPAKDAFLKFAGFLKKTIDTTYEDPTFAQPVRKELQNIRVGVIEVVEPDRLRRLLYDLSDDKFVSSGLGGILGLIEIHNFHKALTAFSNNKNSDRNWELFAPLTASFLKIPAAIKDVKDAAVAAAKVARGGATDVAQNVFRTKGITQSLQKAASRKILGETIKQLNLIGDLIDIGVTLSSFTENLAQNDDAAIADAIGFTGATLGLIGFAFSIPVLGWVAGLVGLAAWIAKAFLFKEDTPVEIWINNGPFARGEEYHDQFSYNRSTTITKIKDAESNWVDTPCTVHEYGSFQFLVDSKGTLVHARVAPPPATAVAGYGVYIPGTMENLSPCNVAPDGNVYLKADPEKNIPADTHVATIGQPFRMHSLLKPHVKEKPRPNSQTKNAKNNSIIWRYPHDAYVALADAIYRPRATITETAPLTGYRQATVSLKINLPFYIPGKSELYVQLEEKGGKSTDDKNTENISSLKSVKDVNLNGPGDFEIVRTVEPGIAPTFTAWIRLDLYGDSKVQLPFEPMFCGTDIETKIDEYTEKGKQSKEENKWIVVEKKISLRRQRDKKGQEVARRYRAQ